MHNFAGFDLTPLESLSLFVTLVIYFLCFVAVLASLAFLVLQTILSVRKPRTKNGQNRRRTVVICWAVVLFILAYLLVADFFQAKNSDEFRTKLAVGYARTYQDPVVLLKTTPYKVGFEGKWGQLEISSAGEPFFSVTQVPVSELGRQYFNPDQGYCDFQSMRENYDLRRSEESCVFLKQIGDFKFYSSSLDYEHPIHYATYHNLALRISASTSQAETLVADMYVTDRDALVEALQSDAFTGEYAEVLDRWQREGKFSLE